MKWRTIRGAILILLLIMNAILFFVLYNQKKEGHRVTVQRLETMEEIYRKEGILWNLKTEIPSSSAGYLKLRSTDMKINVYNLLGEDVEEVYLYGEKVQYLQKNGMIITDRQNSSAEYFRTGILQGKKEGNTAQEMAEAFIKQFAVMNLEFALQKNQVQEEGWYFSYYQELEGELLLFNQMEVWVDGKGVKNAKFRYYSAEKFPVKAEEEYPLDQLLYQCLRQIQEQEAPVKELRKIQYGYRMEQQGKEIIGIPCVLFYFDSEITYTIDRIIS